MVAVLLAAGAAKSQVLGPDAMMKGIEFTRAAGDTYNSNDAEQSLEQLHATGANWVTIVPIWWMADTGRSAIYPRPGASPSDGEIEYIIDKAHDLGMQVFLKPEIRCSTGVWIGRHRPHSPSWYNYYRVFIMHYAQLAQETKCEMLSAGGELDSTALDSVGRVQWTQNINWVKGEYLGPVAYAADWRTYRSIPFWDSLDVVGINAYFPVWTHVPPSQPDFQSLCQEWSGCISQIESFRDSLGLPDSTKPILFTEVGYRSVTGCDTAPWNETSTGTYSPTDQRSSYMAALHSTLGKPWFAGWFWHEWTTDPDQGGTGDLSYTPKGKLAQEVLRRWFASIGSQKGADMFCSERDRYGYPRTDSSLMSLAEHNANWVAIIGPWQANALDSSFSSIEPSTAQTPTDASLRHAIETAHSQGLNVMLKAQVTGPALEWQGTFDPTHYGVRDAWFSEFTDFVSHYAAIAQQESCEMFCTGVEDDPTTDDPGEAQLWASEVMPAVRDSYSGPVVYAALWPILDGAPTKPRIWSLMDFVGIDAYFQLFPTNLYGGNYPLDTTSAQHPNVYDLQVLSEWSWEAKWIPRLKSLYDSVQKPIMFPEIGYRSIDSTAFHTSDGLPVGWVTSASGVSCDLYSVCFPADTVTGYVVGDSGRILKTGNSGANWVTCNSGTTNRLYSVDFPVADTGYAVGEDGTILRTTNGWASYENRAEEGMTVSYHSVCFPETPDVGFVVGDGGVILKTTNGGSSWTRLYCVDAGDTVRVALRCISFVQPDAPLPMVGYIVGDGGTVLKSTDAGLSWEALSEPVTVDLNSVSLVSSDTCFAAGDSNHLLWTTNGGESWADSVYRTDWGPHDFKAVCVPEYHSARFVLGTGGAIMRAGDDWPLTGSQQQVPIGPDFRGIQFRTLRHGEGDSVYYEYVGFAVGNGGTILKASHGGRMLVDFNEQANCYEAAFEAFWREKNHPDPLPWFYGFHFWNWDLDHEPMLLEHEGQIAQMPPQQKPAGEVMREWYDWDALLPPDTLAWMARHYPTGGLDVVVPASGKVNVPLVLAKLESHNWEEGGSADSARLLHEYYGPGDSLLAADTTAWFRFVADTTWRFLHGGGKYRFYVQYLDVPNELSPPYPDFEDSVIIFDTVGATGDVIINEGARFATSPTCTLRLTAQDSCSGVAAMRFINDAPKVDLVVGGSFTATAGAWQHENSEVDTLLHMARLTVAPTAARVRQFIPAESISAHAGDSCALEASVLAHVHEDDAVGEASFWFYSIREDSLNQHDTLWQLVDSAGFSGNLLSLTGRYGLSKHFLLTEPVPESGWVWKGGMVKVEASAENGSGSVWTDDVGADVAFANDSGGVEVWAYDDSARVWASFSGALPTTGDFEGTQLCDMNADGFVDLCALGGGQLKVWLGDGAGNWTEAADITTASPGYYSAFRAGADFDHNGFPDMAFITDEGSWPSDHNVAHAFKESSPYESLAIFPVFPRGGEKLANGSVQFIDWWSATLEPEAPNVALWLSTTGPSGPWWSIYIGQSNGRFQWTVPPGVKSPDCYIRYQQFNPPFPDSATATTPRAFTIGDTAPGVHEGHDPQAAGRNLMPSIVHGVLNLQSAIYSLQSEIDLFDISGRRVMELRLGANDVRALAPGVYFIRGPKTEDERPGVVRKVIITR